MNLVKLKAVLPGSHSDVDRQVGDYTWSNINSLRAAICRPSSPEVVMLVSEKTFFSLPNVGDLMIPITDPDSNAVGIVASALGMFVALSPDVGEDIILMSFDVHTELQIVVAMRHTSLTTGEIKL